MAFWADRRSRKSAPETRRQQRFDRAAWRAEVLVRGERIEADLIRVLGGKPVDGVAISVRDAVLRSRNAAEHVEPARRFYRALADWWRGASVEIAWRNIHMAEQQLVLLLPTDELHLVVHQIGGAPASKPAGTPPADELPDRASLRQELMEAQARSDTEHVRARVVRNLLYVSSLVIATIVGGLWAGNVVHGSVVGFGALGGAASIAFAFAGPVQAGPYNVLAAQVLVKVPLGAATASMAVVLLSLGSTPGTTATNAYAVVFGFSQQAFPRLIDQKASMLAGTAARRGGPPSVSTSSPVR